MSEEFKERLKAFIDITGLFRGLAAAGVGALVVVFAWGQADARREVRLERLERDGSKALATYREIVDGKFAAIDTRLGVLMETAIETKSDIKWLIRQSGAKP